MAELVLFESFIFFFAGSKVKKQFRNHLSHKVSDNSGINKGRNGVSLTFDEIIKEWRLTGSVCGIRCCKMKREALSIGQVTPTRSKAYTVLEVDNYGMKHAEFMNLILWKNEKGMQPERKKRPHPFVRMILRLEHSRLSSKKSLELCDKYVRWDKGAWQKRSCNQVPVPVR